VNVMVKDEGSKDSGYILLKSVWESGRGKGCSGISVISIPLYHIDKLDKILPNHSAAVGKAIRRYFGC
jgi:hypothetical protein